MSALDDLLAKDNKNNQSQLEAIIRRVWYNPDATKDDEEVCDQAAAELAEIMKYNSLFLETFTLEQKKAEAALVRAEKAEALLSEILVEIQAELAYQAKQGEKE